MYELVYLFDIDVRYRFRCRLRLRFRYNRKEVKPGQVETVEQSQIRSSVQSQIDPSQTSHQVSPCQFKSPKI